MKFKNSQIWFLFYIISLLLIISRLVVVVEAEHHCGVGKFSRFLSEVVSGGCDAPVLSENCCKPHDRCYDAAQELYRIERNEAIEKCDVVFNECIWNKCYSDDKRFCRSFIFVTHGKLVQMVTKFCTWTGNIFCNGY